MPDTPDTVEQLFTRQGADHIETVMVFGSRARGYDVHDESDIDLLVISPQATIWDVHTDPTRYGLSWPDDFPEPHFVECTPSEFNQRWHSEEDRMVTNIREEGFCILGNDADHITLKPPDGDPSFM